MFLQVPSGSHSANVHRSNLQGYKGIFMSLFFTYQDFNPVIQVTMFVQFLS